MSVIPVIPEGADPDILAKRQFQWWQEQPGLHYGTERGRVEGWFATAKRAVPGQWSWWLYGPEGEDHPVVCGVASGEEEAMQYASLALTYLPDRGRRPPINMVPYETPKYEEAVSG